MLIPLIESCLSNLPKNRPLIVRVCNQLESQLVDRDRNEFTISVLQQEMRKKDAELQAKNAEIQRKEVEIQQKNAEIQERDAGNSIEIQRKNGEIQRKDVEIQRKNNEIHYLCTSLHDKDAVLETLRSDMSKLTSNTFHKVNNEHVIIYNIILYILV